MTLTFGSFEFDHATYDARSDVLYLRAGPPRAAARTVATGEGHAIRYDGDGEVIGVTLVNARWLLERDGEISLSDEHVSRALVEPLLAES
jgi:uncharacterized protein YuzE